MFAQIEKKSRAVRWAMALGLGVALAMPVTPSFVGVYGVTAAYADDDDGGDDDGGGGGANRGGRSSGERSDRAGRPRAGNVLRYFQRQFRGSKPRRKGSRRANRRAAPVAALPARGDNQLVAMGLNDGQISTLQAEGYAVVERATLSTGELVKLTKPAAVSLEDARTRVRALAPAAPVDFNHFYAPSQDTACGGSPCVAPSLVGWPTGGDEAASTCRASGVRIGLVDTAINPEHETFARSKIQVMKLEESEPAQSSRQHGTAVASLLVGTGGAGTPGLTPDAQLIAVDVFRTTRGQDRAEAYDLIRALDMLRAENVDVLNMSLSGPDNALLKAAVEQLSQAGAVLVAAAGNDGPGAAPLFPAAYQQVIAVTAVDRRKSAYRRANRGDHVDIAAPGVGVWAAASVSGAKPKTGTSFAAPFVAAAAALGKGSGLSEAEIKARLESTATDLGDPGKDAVYGWGLLNASGLCRL